MYEPIGRKAQSSQSYYLSEQEKNTAGPFILSAYSVLLFLGGIGLIIIIYALFLSSVNYSWNQKQDGQDVLTQNRIINLTIKDMQLMDQDVLFMNNMSSLSDRIDAEEAARMQADMALMDNATSVSAIVDNDVQDRIEGDMALMDTFANLQDQLDNATTVDMGQLSLLMMKMQNITDLDARLEETIENREAVDSILRDNFTTLSERIDVLETDVNVFGVESSNRFNAQQMSLDEFVEKNMIMMNNISDLKSFFDSAVEQLENEDSLTMFTIYQAELKCDLLESQLDILQENITDLQAQGALYIETINGINADENGDFLLTSENDPAGNGDVVTVNTVPGLITLGYDFFTTSDIPRADFFYRKRFFVLANGFKTGARYLSTSTPNSLYWPTDSGNPCSSSYGSSDFCITAQDNECRQGDGDETSSLNAKPSSCGQHDQEWPFGSGPVPRSPETGGIKFTGKGSFIVTVEAFACIRVCCGGDVTMGMFMDVGTSQLATASGREFSYTQCSADIAASDDNFPNCRDDGDSLGRNDNNICSQPCFPFALQCTRHIHHQSATEVTHVAARVYGYNDLEGKCIANPTDGTCVYTGGLAMTNNINYDTLEIRFTGAKVF